MSPDVLLLLLIVGPAVVLMILRSNASLVFLSACLGLSLVQLVGGDAGDFIAMFAPAVSNNNLKLGLLLLPVLLTTIFMIKTVQGGKLVFNVLPALGTGFLLTLLIVPLLPQAEAHNLQAAQSWHLIGQLQSLVIGASALLCLLFLWMQRPKHALSEKHKK